MKINKTFNVYDLMDYNTGRFGESQLKFQLLVSYFAHSSILKV
jgi:hypothetical protein